MKYNIIRKRQISKANELLKLKIEFNIENDKEYKIEIICKSKVYGKKATS